MASDAYRRLGQWTRLTLVFIVLALALSMTSARAAPYAAFVIDARTGEVIHSRNADSRLHPASLTKMMTLYVVFEAVENGEISLDSLVEISANAASEVPSKIGFRQGQKVRLRHLIRAAAVKSANDAATALGEAISGSEAAFAARMNRTAKALGMNQTHFVNMHGLTADGHLSSARDMTTLGRHLFFDYPQYYNLFSRQSADVGVKTVPSTNRRFLSTYEGADGIKTGYTRASGSNLTASARRGSKHIIATIFGGTSGPARDAQMAELLDMGFARARNNVAVRAPAKPPYVGNTGTNASAPLVASNEFDEPGGAGKTIRVVGAPVRSIRPAPRPVSVLDSDTSEAVNAVIANILDTTEEEVPERLAEAEAVAEAEVSGAEATPAVEKVPAGAAQAAAPVVNASLAAPDVAPAPPPRPEDMILVNVESAATAPRTPEFVTRMSTSGGRHWGINVGVFPAHYEAERVLLRTALSELATLGEALRKVSKSRTGFNANFVGMTKEGAELACRRLAARDTSCTVIEAGQQG
jgi:D-alanyl-D-alanine carboxypeptidase